MTTKKERSFEGGNHGIEKEIKDNRTEDRKVGMRKEDSFKKY